MILAICGSLRRDSSNRRLLLSSGLPDVVLYEGLDSLPHFNPDLDVDEPPPAVRELRELLASADGWIISSPEYAHGVPGSLKNALDWLVSDGALIGKPIVLLNASAGGGEHAQAQLAEILKTMSMNVLTQASLMSSVVRRGDAEVAAAVQRSLEALAAAIRR